MSKHYLMNIYGIDYITSCNEDEFIDVYAVQTGYYLTPNAEIIYEDNEEDITDPNKYKKLIHIPFDTHNLDSWEVINKLENLKDKKDLHWESEEPYHFGKVLQFWDGKNFEKINFTDNSDNFYEEIHYEIIETKKFPTLSERIIKVENEYWELKTTHYSGCGILSVAWEIKQKSLTKEEVNEIIKKW